MATASPLLSIVVPVYQVEAYLPQCLDSIVSQMADDIEVILIDDGSPDSCPEICDAYADKYAQFNVIHQKNAGVSIARQTGAQAANGRYITFLDSDDWFEPDFIGTMRRIITDHAPDIICFGNYRVPASGKIPRPFPLKSGLYTRKDIVSEIFPFLIEDQNGHYFPNSLGKLFLTALYRKNQVQGKKIMMGEDGACVKPCVYHARSLYVDAGMYYNYRLTDGSVTASGRPLLWDGPVLIAQHYQTHIDLSQYDLREQVTRNLVHNVFNVAVSQFSGGSSYLQTAKRIRAKLKHPYFRQAAVAARFRSPEGILCKLAVRYRLCGIMYLRWLQKYGRRKPRI